MMARPPLPLPAVPPAHLAFSHWTLDCRAQSRLLILVPSLRLPEMEQLGRWSTDRACQTG